jgi:hypothetical protein
LRSATATKGWAWSMDMNEIENGNGLAKNETVKLNEEHWGK